MKNFWGSITAAILSTCFIFCQSLQPAVVSDGYSLGLLGILRNLLAFVPIFDAVTNHFLRKAAHWFEFCVQGWLLCAVVFSANYQRKNLFCVLFIGLLTAVIDEYIQLFVPGRAGRVEDILLDFAGTASGVGIYFLFEVVKSILRKSQKGGSSI